MQTSVLAFFKASLYLPLAFAGLWGGPRENLQAYLWQYLREDENKSIKVQKELFPGVEKHWIRSSILLDLTDVPDFIAENPGNLAFTHFTQEEFLGLYRYFRKASLTEQVLQADKGWDDNVKEEDFFAQPGTSCPIFILDAVYDRIVDDYERVLKSGKFEDLSRQGVFLGVCAPNMERLEKQRTKVSFSREGLITNQSKRIEHVILISNGLSVDIPFPGEVDVGPLESGKGLSIGFMYSDGSVGQAYLPVAW